MDKKIYSVAVDGPSGAGKSTLVRCINMLERPTSGTVVIDGLDIGALTEKQLRPVRRQISMIFQEPMTSLNPVFTIGYQLSEVLRYHKGMGKKEAMEKAVQLLKDVGISRPEMIVKNYPHELSGGMLQRAMIAAAIVAKPRLLLLDEPTTALDVTIQAQILELMQSLQKELGMAIIMITHDLGVVAQMCDEVIVMYAGSICEQGTADEIFYNPCHEYTKGLIRSIPTVNNDDEKLEPITGTPIDLLNMPKGCPFAPRCDAAMKICIRERCERMEINADHAAACWMNVKQVYEEAKGGIA